MFISVQISWAYGVTRGILDEKLKTLKGTPKDCMEQPFREPLSDIINGLDAYESALKRIGWTESDMNYNIYKCARLIECIIETKVSAADANGEVLCEPGSIVLTDKGLEVSYSFQDTVHPVKRFVDFLKTTQKAVETRDQQELTDELATKLVRIYHFIRSSQCLSSKFKRFVTCTDKWAAAYILVLVR